MHRLLEGAHVAEELAGSEDGHAALAPGVAGADFDGASYYDEAGVGGLAGGEDSVAARELEEVRYGEDFVDLGCIEAFEDREVRQEGPGVEGGFLQAPHVR